MKVENIIVHAINHIAAFIMIGVPILTFKILKYWIKNRNKAKIKS
jgi:hypothetical protein